MFLPGLVSITFRQLTPRQIVDLVAQAGAVGIEWGGDVHVPPGDVARASEVAKMTRDAGLQVAAYGSYYRCKADANDPFEKVLDSAVALGAKNIRVWAGTWDSDKVTPDDRTKVVEDIRRICTLAQQANVKIVTEWHGGTLTDTGTSARQLFAEVNHPNLWTYWQPRTAKSFDLSWSEMDVALPKLAGIHVFSWSPADATKLALAEGETEWKKYLPRLTSSQVMFALIEFVKGNAPEQFLEDAKVLRRWLEETRSA